MVKGDNATVYGVIVDLSPIKCSKSNLAVTSMLKLVNKFNRIVPVQRPRMISFEPKLRETSRNEGKAVALINCRVKPGKFDSSSCLATPKWRYHPRNLQLYKKMLFRIAVVPYEWCYGKVMLVN